MNQSGASPGRASARARATTAAALGLALATLPAWLHLPVDADRFLPLLFLPCLWLAWRHRLPLRRRETVLVCWAAAAMAVAATMSRNFAAALVMGAAVGLAFTGALVARSLASDRVAIRIALGGILLGSITGFFTVWIGWGADGMYFPTYWSARLFGGHAFAGAVAGLALLIETPVRGPSRWLPAIGTLLAWIALAWSGSRAPALALAVMLAVWFWRGGAIVRRRLLIWAPLLALLALACSRPLGTPYPQLGWWPALSRTVTASSTQELTSERTDYWQACWTEIRRSPWIGHGADAYQFIQPKQPGNQPHNTFIQWVLEYGLLGAPPFFLLLALAQRPLRRPPVAPDPASADSDYFQRWAAAAISGATVYAVFDGVGYHMVIFMPVAVFAGLALGGDTPAPAGAVPPATLPARLLAHLACLLLVVHTWLGVLLLRARSVGPDSVPARVLRAFPSTTHGILNWTERWRPGQPEIAREWVKWAQGVSPNAGALHAHAAQLYLMEKNWAAAEQELMDCLPKVLPKEKPDVIALLENLRRFVAENPLPPSTLRQP